jgi:hypothetical protein
MTNPPTLGAKMNLRLEGCEVHLVFIQDTEAEADALMARLFQELQQGTLKLELTKAPIKIEGGTVQ